MIIVKSQYSGCPFSVGGFFDRGYVKCMDVAGSILSFDGTGFYAGDNWNMTGHDSENSGNGWNFKVGNFTSKFCFRRS